MQSFHTQTQLHIILRTQPQLSTQTMNSMKLKNVVPLTLDFNEYAEATLDKLEEEANMTPTKLLYIYVCVFSSHPFWTSSSLDVPAGVTQEEGHTGFLIHLPSAVRALIFVARRIQPFLSLVDREVELCVPTI